MRHRYRMPPQRLCVGAEEVILHGFLSTSTDSPRGPSDDIAATNRLERKTSGSKLALRKTQSHTCITDPNSPVTCEVPPSPVSALTAEALSGRPVGLWPESARDTTGRPSTIAAPPATIQRH